MARNPFKTPEEKELEDQEHMLVVEPMLNCGQKRLILQNLKKEAAKDKPESWATKLMGIAKANKL